MDLDRVKGTLFGAACGDALGLPLEFTHPSNPTAFPGKQSGISGMMKGGTWNKEAGQVSDDTHMAICLSEALADSIREGRPYEPALAAVRYMEWTNHSFDVGGLTSSSLSDARMAFKRADVNPRWAYWNGYSAWGGKRCGNGSLMRISPIGASLEGTEERRRAAFLDSGITHFDPRCLLACSAYCAAISEAVYRDRSDPVQMLDTAKAELKDGVVTLLAVFANYPDICSAAKEAAEVLSTDLEAASHPDPLLYGQDDRAVTIDGSGSGFVRTAFRLAFWELMNRETYEEAILDTVNRGGDADTNGAIVGGLFGARVGIHKIPKKWVKAVQNALAGDKSKLGTTYHPRRFDRLIQVLDNRQNGKIHCPDPQQTSSPS